jgi:predicted transcriptional regulator
MEPGFPPVTELPNGYDVERLTADFGVALNAIANVVSVEQVIEDTPCWE